jgi:hypothetical protein
VCIGLFHHVLMHVRCRRHPHSRRPECRAGKRAGGGAWLVARRKRGGHDRRESCCTEVIIESITTFMLSMAQSIVTTNEFNMHGDWMATVMAHVHLRASRPAVLSTSTSGHSCKVARKLRRLRLDSLRQCQTSK